MESENELKLGENADLFTSSSPLPESNDYQSAESSIFTELISPLNVSLLVLCAFLLYHLLKSRSGSSDGSPAGGSQSATLAPMKKQDFTLAQLREYNGTANDGRILVAVNGKVFDVTGGRKTYGPG